MEKHIKLVTFGEITDPIEFERHCGNLLIAAGFKDVHVTQSSGDFGVDILANDEEASIAIQCKLYSDPVGVHAIQEVVSGKCYYKRDKSAVITNSTFTTQAAELAKATGTILWDKMQVMKWELNLVQLLQKSNSESQQNTVEVSDDVFERAIQTAIKHGYVSTSMIQRQLQIGYSVAQSIISLMEQKGLISPADGAKSRQVLINRWP